MSLGFMQTGRVNIVAAAENNPNARKTYKRNFKIKMLYSDVQTIDYHDLKKTVDQIDIVIGGPPCQGFSNANRQHTTIISMNNRMIKEFVRAICELQPKAFVMENVAMLRSKVHRFMVDENDFHDDCIMNLDLTEDKIELLPSTVMFDGALDFLKDDEANKNALWEEPFYKIINTLYRYRINQEKFDATLKKYKKKLATQLTQWIQPCEENDRQNQITLLNRNMAKEILHYLEHPHEKDLVIMSIESPLFIQRALLRKKELIDNNIHVYEYLKEPSGVVGVVKSYAVRDYIYGVLNNSPYNYDINEGTLNAIDYGAPQRRERFILVGFKRELNQTYSFPKSEFSENEYRTVRDAISDIEEVVPATTIDSRYIELPPCPTATDLEKELRGRLLYNHVTTATRDTAMARFKALDEGQNFHDLDPKLKSTYSNVARTQNTLYMRLKYDEPCGTVVNVRKSMWIHPICDRAISIREAARLQTFPDSFIFEGTKDSQYQQIGNAVPPFLARAIARSIIEMLDHINE